MTVARVYHDNAEVVGIEESLRRATDLMLDRNVTTLIVRDQHDKPAGVVTDRDLARKVLTLGINAGEVSIGEIMSNTRVDAVGRHTSLECTLAAMRTTGVLSLPVVDGRGVLLGTVCAQDILIELALDLNVLPLKSPRRQKKLPTDSRLGK